MGTGKSTLAANLEQALGWKVIASDMTRKRLAGTAPVEPHRDAFGTGLYSSDWTARTYTALLQEAKLVLSDARSVILDASFAAQSDRQASASIAARMQARPIFAECKCPRNIALLRLAQRWRARTATGRRTATEDSDAQLTTQASDGRPELYDAQASAWQPVTSVEAGYMDHIEVLTTAPPASSVDQLLRVLGIQVNGG